MRGGCSEDGVILGEGGQMRRIGSKRGWDQYPRLSKVIKFFSLLIEASTEFLGESRNLIRLYSCPSKLY